MSQEIEKLSQFVAGTRWEDVPPAVQRHAKLVLLDTFGVILAGAEQPEVRRLQAGLGATAGTGATVYARGWPVTDPGRAALLNGIAGRTLELCEGHVEVSAQAAVQIVPAVLALAEAQRSSGRDILTALVVGYDFAIRLGAATTRRPLAHPLGQASLLGAIAGGARVRGLDAAHTSTAVRIGANLVVSASYSNVVAGATTINVNGGMSGLVGTLAPELASAGFTAREDAIEEAMAHLAGDAFDGSKLLEQLGTRWEIHRNQFRLRACCNPIYPALDALEDALAALSPRPEDVDRIEVATYKFASGMRNADPPNYFGSKYSLPHAAAALVVKGHLGYDAFTEAAVHDATISALRRRVHITEDPQMSAALPRLKPASVTVTLKDGRTATRRCDDDRRAGAALDEPAIREKFRGLAALVLTQEGVAAVEEAIDRSEQWTSVDALTSLVRRYGRAAA